AEDGIRDFHVTGVQTCALPISIRPIRAPAFHANGAWPSPSASFSLAASSPPAFSNNPPKVKARVDLPAPFSPRITVAVPAFTRRSEERRVGKESRTRCGAYREL